MSQPQSLILLPAKGYTFIYNYAALHVRKAAHMYGWDIMPRIISEDIAGKRGIHGVLLWMKKI